MLITMLKSKIAYAQLTCTQLYYVGSITIPIDIMTQAKILENEKVQIVNLNNGARLETYVIPGTQGNNHFALNGPAARQAQAGDLIFILSYGLVQASSTPSPPKIINLASLNNLPQAYYET